MSTSSRAVDSIRIDVPLQTQHAYLYVEREHERWDPWWRALFERLLEFLPPDTEWSHEPVQNVYYLRPNLNEGQCVAIFTLLCGAPAEQIEAHRTLRRAVDLDTEHAKRIGLMYFSHQTASQ